MNKTKYYNHRTNNPNLFKNTLIFEILLMDVKTT